MSKQVALYAGSFHPFHIGHLDILKQAEKIFDKVVIGVGHNAAKPDMSEVAIRALYALNPPNDVVKITGTISKFMQSYGTPLTLVRGIRDAMDLQAEVEMRRYLQALDPALQVVYFFSSPEVSHVSSSGIRHLQAIGTVDSLDLANQYIVHPHGQNNSGNPAKNAVNPANDMFSSMLRTPGK